MLLRVGYELIFDLKGPVPMTLMLSVHPGRQKDILASRCHVDPEVQGQSFVDAYGNNCLRIVAPPGRLRLFADHVLEDDGLPDPVDLGARQHPVEELPSECLPFLLNSRYCEVDKLVPVAWELFGNTEPGWPRVQAICDWVNTRISFGYAYARPSKSAFDVYAERVGVCRDFAHLALTFCRCMNIPARYTTGYLGDIGVTANPMPMDFSGWFEVYLGGGWHTFDARHNTRRIGRVVMAYGRDATDVALTTSYGSAPLVGFKVWSKQTDTSDLTAAVW